MIFITLQNGTALSFNSPGLKFENKMYEIYETGTNQPRRFRAQEIKSIFYQAA